MLRRIEAENFFTFEDFTADFSSGMAVITGETGSGKSMVLRSMGLVLGDSFAHDLIRDHARETRLRMVFDISNNQAASSWLSQHQLDKGSGELEIIRAARYRKNTRASINGNSTDLGQLRELAELLVEIHGQKSRHSLFSASAQLQAYDEYIQALPLLDKLGNTSKKINSTREKIAEIETDNSDSIELVRYQYDELVAAQLSEGLWEELQAEQRRLSNYEQHRACLDELIERIQGDSEAALIQGLHKASQLAEQLCEYNKSYAEIAQMLERAQIEVNEAASTLAGLSDASLDETDPASALVRLDERISTVFNLARKHKIKPEQLYQQQQELQTRLQNYEGQAKALEQLKAEETEQLAQWNSLADQLSELRRSQTGSFASEINAYLGQLNMDYADFRLEFELRPDGEINQHGRERVRFTISTVANKPHEPINRISSGGELSRISLAVRLCANQKSRHSDTTLVFDEIDSGIGGESAERLGRLLGQLGSKQQILCITHLATVAAYARTHYRVSNQDRSQSVSISSLEGKNRQQELARMLTGDAVSKPSLQAAKELLAKATQAELAIGN